MTLRVEDSIITGLLFDEEYSRKVVPHLRSEYFQDRAERAVYEECVTFFNRYNTLITKEALRVQLNSRSGLSDTELVDVINKINDMEPQGIS